MHDTTIADEYADESSYQQTSKKRPLENPNDGYDRNKRSNFGVGKPTLKFLIPNFMAGKLIGKGGSNIGELQTKYSASIHISKNREYYPGTSDRIVCVSASTDQIIEFNDYLIEQFNEEETSERSNPSLKPELKLVVSNIAAGLVIGKGGASIRAIEADNNGARIQISKKDESITGERLVVISGEAEQRAAASKRVIELMSSVPDQMSNSNIEYSNFNSSSNGNLEYNTSNSSRQQAQNTRPMYNLQTDNSNILQNALNDINAVNNIISSVRGNLDNNYANSSTYQPKSGVRATFQAEMEVPGEMVGSIVGKHGSIISEIYRTSGAKLQFSGKDEFVPGTTNRILTITGGMYQVQNAYILVDEKLAQLKHELARGFGRQ